MTNFNTNNKVLSNLDVKLNKLGGYLYVNEQGNIEVKDIKPSIINIWEGCSNLTSPINITNFIDSEKDTHINLLISGFYSNATNGRASSSQRESGKEFKGIPSFFKAEFYSSFGGLNMSILESNFSVDNFETNSKSAIRSQIDEVIGGSMIANESFCNLISITIPRNIIENVYSSSYLSTRNDGDNILTGLEIYKNRDFYYTKSYNSQDIRATNKNLYYLNSLLKLQSGYAQLTIGVTNQYLGSNYWYDGSKLSSSNIKPYEDGTNYRNSEYLKLTSVSILKESKIN